MVKRWFRGLCASRLQNVEDDSGDQNIGGKKRIRNENSRPASGDSSGQKEKEEPNPPALPNFNDEIGSGNDNRSNDYENNDNDDDESLDLNDLISDNKPLTNLESESDNASLDGAELFELDSPIPQPKKKFLEAALTAKSLSDLNYVHSTDPSDASKWKSMTDLKYDDIDDGSLGDNELFEIDDEPIATKNKFLDAALAAKSISDLNFVFSAPVQEASMDQECNDSNDSFGGAELFLLGSPIVRPKKKFLEAAFMAKSLSDLNYLHSGKAPMRRRKSMTDLKFADDQSLGDNELFELDEPIPRSKKQFLEAALAAKSISDLNFVFMAPVQETSIRQDSNENNESLGGVEVFDLGLPIVRPKKKFLEAAFPAKSFSNINYIHSEQASIPRRKSLTDLKFADDQSLGDNELFELDEPIPTKKQFLDAALAAKSISDLNFVYSAKVQETAMSEDSSEIDGSLGSVELFELDAPIVRPKKQFLEAAFMAKSLSDLNYVHSSEAPKVSRRKSLTDLEFDEDGSLGDNELFGFDEPIPTKKQFLEAALTAKSISNLNFVYSAAQEKETALSEDSNENNGSLGSIELFQLDSPIVRPKKQFLDAAFMAKSMSDLNYVHSAKAPMASMWKSMTDLKYDDDRSLGDNELFELDDTQVVRPKKQFLEAALMAKSISDLKFMYLNKSTYSSSIDNESRDDASHDVPEHLLGLSQPYLFHSSDIHSIDDDGLFESLSGDEPIERPILKAALEAKAQQKEGIVVVGNRDAPRTLSNDHAIETEIVPEHLVIANQPVNDHANDNYSIEVEDIFEHPSGEENERKPLLQAALAAQEQLEDEEFAEEFGVSLSHLGAENLIVGPSSAIHKFSKSVPDHLAVVNQPTNALPTLDELSIDGDRLFDSPEPKRKNSLLEAALRAKKETERFEISRSELRMLNSRNLQTGGG